jgi:hypothetical protein
MPRQLAGPQSFVSRFVVTATHVTRDRLPETIPLQLHPGCNLLQSRLHGKPHQRAVSCLNHLLYLVTNTFTHSVASPACQDGPGTRIVSPQEPLVRCAAASLLQRMSASVLMALCSRVFSNCVTVDRLRRYCQLPSC